MKQSFLIFSITFGISAGVSFFAYKNHTSLSIGDRSIASSSIKSIADINYRRSYFMMDDNLPYKGLTHIPGKDEEYIQRLFGKFVQAASKISKDDFDDDKLFNSRFYHNFILTSLMVPHHESTLMHFTKRDPKTKCYFSNNILDPKNPEDDALNYYPILIKELEAKSKTKEFSQADRKELKDRKTQLNNAKLLDKNIKYFFKAMNTGEKIFYHCSHFYDRESAQQILFAADYADIGILMFNSKSHPDFFETNRIFDFDLVLDYGLNYLFDGYKELSLNAQAYSCLGEDQTSFHFYKNLTRSSWGGKYNSGNVGWSCRYTDPRFLNATPKDGTFFVGKRNDEGFLRNYKKFMELDSSLFHKYLPEKSLERKAFFELLNNVKHGKNDRVYLNQILEFDYDSQDELITENIIDEIEENIIDNDSLEIDSEGNITIEETIAINEDSKNESDDDLTKVGENSSEDDIHTPQPEQDVEKDVKNNDLISKVEIDANKNSMTVEDQNKLALQVQEDVVKRYEEAVNDITPPKGEGAILPKKDIVLTHIITGFNINIRSAADTSLSYDTICGNTQVPSGPIEVSVISEENDFTELDLSSIEKYIDYDKCPQIKTAFVYKDFVKPIPKKSVNDSLKEANLLGWVTIRDRPSASKGIEIGTIGPAYGKDFVKVMVSDYKEYGNGRYIWYQIVREDGSSGWIYAGESGSKNFRVEFE